MPCINLQYMTNSVASNSNLSFKKKSAKDLKMQIITRTVYGADLQNTLYFKLPYTFKENTTLNEKFGVQAGVVPAVGVIPTVNYYAIGNGGHRNSTGADGQPFTSPIQHSAEDAALYKHLPFIVREVSNDLDVVTRQKYAMRKEILVNGLPYIAYYLKRLDFTGVSTAMTHNTVVDGVTTTVPFVPTGANLNPVAPAIPPTGVVTTNGDFLATSAILRLDFSATDVAELINVATTLFDNELYAVISEIALVSGVDRVVTALDSTGTQFNYNEAIVAQIVTHITRHYSVGSANGGFDFALELGATEPLIGVTTGL